MSPVLKKVIKEFIRLKENKIKLSYEETISALTKFKELSEDHILIDKAIGLIKSVNHYNKEVKQLSKRENEVLNLIGHCFSSKEIAQILDITQSTVSTHRKNIIKKLNLSKTIHLNILAYDFIKNNKTNI